MVLNNLLLTIFLIIFFILNIIWILFDPLIGTFQFLLKINILEYYIKLGIDAISFFFIYLTGLLISLCLLFSLISKKTINEKKNQMLLIFSIGLLLLFAFMALDLLLFYISFEAILIPFFIYIGISGYRSRRIHASYLFFSYTMIGSFFMLLSIFFFYLQVGSTDLEILWNIEFIGNKNYLLWIGIFITFAIKIPMFPFHIWSPEAHVEAPTEGSVSLAGLLLKSGSYGFLRFLFPILPELTFYFSPFVIMISIISIIHSSFSTLRQIDIKRIIAYSSISHMNMSMLGLFSYNEIAFIGSIFLMIGHGIVSSGLSFTIGMLYNRYNTKIIYYFSGTIYFMPILSFFFFMFSLGNIGMPGTSNFIGELLILCGISLNNQWISIIASIIGIFLCTIYSIWMYNKIIFMLPKFSYLIINDLFLFEIILLLPLIIFMIIFGIYPNIILSLLDYSILYHFFELLY